MIKYILILSVFSLFLFQSCDEDSFSQVVEIDIPAHESKPVLTLQIAAGQLQLVALVSNSKGIIDPDSIYKIPEDAEVNLFKNGTLLTPLQYDNLGLKYTHLLTDGLSDVAGDDYLLEAKLVGYEPVRATQIMPMKPIITDASYEIEGTIDSDGYRVDEVIVDIKDAAPNEVNYYGIQVFHVYYNIDNNGDTLNINRNDVYLDSNDPLLSYSSRYSLIFTDEAFTNGTFQVRGFSYGSASEEAGIEIELYQLTKDAFFFERSYIQYFDALDNPFAEPVTVHNNIEGGYGIFSLVNKTIFKVR